ncbi:hypothetical protein PPACK8108_LOCUS24290 [Phakopsora pachyrhizi]|uniref:Uncharacterized protein n=1 Tax=Phakopsora pachyrhizi TaxID=170000 RepID=A0AAV0BS17_PHAPC|nr:hypothetical protein PPACK8108_LOCUS24290 [Phakopsora pachyrhizi]
MEDTGYEALEESDPEQAPGARRAPISRKPSRKDPLRIQVICAAVQEGSLPASALENELRQDSSIDDDDENEGRKGSKDDETIKAHACIAQHGRLAFFIVNLALAYMPSKNNKNYEQYQAGGRLWDCLRSPIIAIAWIFSPSRSEVEWKGSLEPCEIPNCSPYSAGEVLANLIEYTDPSASTLRGSIQLKPSNHPPKLALEDAQRTEKNIHALMALFLSPEELENINERKKSIPGIANMSLINDHGFSIHSLSVKGDNNFEVCYKVTWMGRWHSQR